MDSAARAPATADLTFTCIRSTLDEGSANIVVAGLDGLGATLSESYDQFGNFTGREVSFGASGLGVGTVWTFTHTGQLPEPKDLLARKGQVRDISGFDISGQATFIASVFDVAA